MLVSTKKKTALHVLISPPLCLIIVVVVVVGIIVVAASIVPLASFSTEYIIIPGCPHQSRSTKRPFLATI